MRSRLFKALGLGIAALVAAAVPPLRADDENALKFTVDVAEDFSKFVYTPVSSSDTIPVRGSTFITEGNIFPGGTIEGDGADFSPDAPGAGAWVSAARAGGVCAGAPQGIQRGIEAPRRMRVPAWSGLRGSMRETPR